MRYDLVLRRSSGGRPAYIGRAESREQADSWARKRLKADDVKYGDKIELHRVGDPEVVEIID